MFVGFTRFSLYWPGTTSWVATRRLDEEEYRRRLFDPSRLDMRSEIFFNMSLPQLELAAKNHRVRHVVSYSDRLPKKYRRLLKKAASRYKFLILDECTDDQAPLTAREVLLEEAHLNGSFQFAEYRLDDDDIVSVDYFDRLSAYLNPSFQSMFVSFSAGLTALYVDGELYDTRNVLHRLIAIGLAKICRIEIDGSVSQPPNVNHRKSDTKAPVLLDSREPAYIWMRHPQQDSFTDTSRSEGAGAELQRIRDSLAVLAPASDTSAIQRHFPVISKRIHTAKGPGLVTRPIISKVTEIPKHGLSVTFKPIKGESALSVNVRTDRSREQRNVLVSFDLVDLTGKPVAPEEWEHELGLIGVRYSKARRIGFYRYLKTRDGLAFAELPLNWPDGIMLRGVTFIKFRDPDALVYIEQVRLSASA